MRGPKTDNTTKKETLYLLLRFSANFFCGFSLVANTDKRAKENERKRKKKKSAVIGFLVALLSICY